MFNNSSKNEKLNDNNGLTPTNTESRIPGQQYTPPQEPVHDKPIDVTSFLGYDCS